MNSKSSSKTRRVVLMMIAALIVIVSAGWYYLASGPVDASGQKLNLPPKQQQFCKIFIKGVADFYRSTHTAGANPDPNIEQKMWDDLYALVAPTGSFEGWVGLAKAGNQATQINFQPDCPYPDEIIRGVVSVDNQVPPLSFDTTYAPLMVASGKIVTVWDEQKWVDLQNRLIKLGRVDSAIGRVYPAKVVVSGQLILWSKDMGWNRKVNSPLVDLSRGSHRFVETDVGPHLLAKLSSIEPR